MKIRSFLKFVLLVTLLGGVFITAQPARAQLDVRHYIPPMFSCSTGNQRLHLSTPETTPVAYTVTNGVGTVLASGNVSNAAPANLLVNGNIINCNLAELNTISTTVSARGLIVTASAPIYANIRHNVTGQADLLTAKGYAALGTRFRAGFMRYDTFPVPNANEQSMFIAVMATENNTTVNFSEFKPGVILYGTATSGSPATTNPISVVLNANQSYVIGTRSDQYTGSVWLNDLNGTLITSDKPIAVNTGTWLGGPQAVNGANQDIGIDQMVPESLLGSEYILMQGNGGAGVLETPIVIATVDNTDLTVNGSSPITCTNSTSLPMDAGEYCFLNGLYTAQGNMFVQATQPIYIFQTLAGSTGAQTTGMNFIPPVSTGSESFVDNIPAVTALGAATLNVLARNGASLTVTSNGSPITVPAAQAVTGTTDWVTYRLTSGLIGNVSVFSDQPIAVQFTNLVGNAGAAGYYAGLPEISLEFGDLPAAYSLTTFTDNGARHSINALYLGTTVDAEANGQESTDAGRAAATGDDGTGTDDENGIGVVGTWQEGANGGMVDAIVTGGNGCLSGWIDWNSDNDFNDTGEQVLAMAVVSTGTNRLSFTIPSGVMPSQDFYDLFSRFRLAPDRGIQGDCSDDTAIALTGLIVGGEVEDHYLRFSRPTGTGPGGVALSNGTTSLALWLNAGAGVTASGGSVSTWADQSGYGADVTQVTATNQPIHVVNGLNGQPIIQFDGSNDFLNIPASVIEGKPAFSFFTVFNWNGGGSWQRLWDFGSSTTVNAFVTTQAFDSSTPRFAITTSGGSGEERLTFSNPLPTGSPQLVDVVWGVPNGWGWRNGAPQVSGSPYTLTPASLGSITQNYIGRSTYLADPYLNAAISEFIVYDTALNSARRIIVENYLQAKYNDSTVDDLTIANDIYDGDTTVNGDFDLNVAGIGQEADGDNWTAHSAGIIVQDVSFLQDNGDYLLFGHNVPANENTTDDVPTTGDWDGISDSRWDRHWYFDRTDAGVAGGFVDILFDFSEGGMLSTPSGPTDNYRLLRRANPSGQFEDITAACTDTTSYYGDQVIFRGVDVTCLGSNFTLGTIDGSSSPTAIGFQTVRDVAGSNGVLLLVFVGILGLLVLRTLFLWQRFIRR